MSLSTIVGEVNGFKMVWKCLKELQWVILYKSLIEEQVVLVAGTRSVATHVEAEQVGLAIFVIEPSPQTKELGKSIPGNLSERQA